MEDGRIPEEDLWTTGEIGRATEDSLWTEAHEDSPAPAEERRRTAQSRQRSRSHSSRRPPKKIKLNYRMALCIAVLVCFVLAVLFFALFMGQRGKAKGLQEELTKLGDEKTALTQQVGTLTQENQTMLSGVMKSVPDPTTANTQSLPDLIPQLTEGVYIVSNTGSGYQYLKVPEGYLTDKLNAFRDNADGYKQAASGAAADWTYWVLYSDKVIGMNASDHGFVSTDRSATGPEYDLPAGFSAFVASVFNKSA
ncbi:hypothetical protein RWV98_01955 [Agathobaculum sp. NTUH-O15-33]|uniref:hypothetical protein n=1 Tax=Agathobaculum sp. NTUH-O15-33 TaxID=3079302 RepID=UPI002958AC1C|nr:hypothetical protein [Agathobaculum sp. NTUH-O15-33]WNX85063.1 hypothetical protein RWV98_01955 [Agathobaculum sp. NTUH-O15-33]